MNKLSQLYKTLSDLKDLGFSESEELTQEANDLEEKFIQEEILPLLKENIEPALSQVQRDLLLVVDYKPGQPLSVHISRKHNFSAAPSEEKSIGSRHDFGHKTIKCSPKKEVKGAITHLRVKFSDGDVIEESSAAETLRVFILKVGMMKVQALGLSQSNVPLVTNVLDEKYAHAQKPLQGGWFLMTNSPTAKKKKVIEQIAESLNLKVKVEII